MKKIFASLLMLTLFSCSSPELSKSTAPPEQPTTTIIIEAVTEPETTATEIPPAPTTEPPTEPEVNELLFNNQGIEVYYQGIDQNTIKLCIINPSTELPVHAWIQDVSVNGIFLENVGCEGYAPNYGSNSWSGVLPLEELQNHNILRINELKFTFLIYLGNQLIYNDKEEITITR